jgi:hypothetical protein
MLIQVIWNLTIPRRRRLGSLTSEEEITGSNPAVDVKHWIGFFHLIQVLKGA